MASRRAEAPVAWINEAAANGHTGAGCWAVTRWDELVAVHKDWRTYSSEVGGTEIEELAADAIEADLLPANGRRRAAEPERTEQAWSASS